MVGAPRGPENAFATKEEGDQEGMAKYTFDSTLLSKLLHRTIDLFLKYQYENGFEEPRAREDAIMDIIGALEQRVGAITRPSPR
jgi:hypothetical protein